MYKALILQPGNRPTAYQRWSNPSSHPAQFGNFEEWKEANTSVYRATRETKMQSLHFKVMNRIISCNTYLKQIRIKHSDECDLCGQVDSLFHFFFECPEVQTVWAVICAWFDRVENLALQDLPPKQFVFGVTRDTAKETTINYILMNVKFFVFRQKLFHRGRMEFLQIC